MSFKPFAALRLTSPNSEVCKTFIPGSNPGGTVKSENLEHQELGVIDSLLYAFELLSLYGEWPVRLLMGPIPESDPLLIAGIRPPRPSPAWVPPSDGFSKPSISPSCSRETLA